MDDLSDEEYLYLMSDELRHYLVNWAARRELIYAYYMLRDNIIVRCHANELNSMYLRMMLTDGLMIIGIDE